jgi:drug/metabolite transporter (DMT)-like permease
MSGIPYFGELLAIGSALAWAIGVILFRQAGRTVHPLALNLFKNTVSLMLLAATQLAGGQTMFPHLPISDVWLLLGAGVVGLGISDTFMLSALNRLGAGLNAIMWTFYSPLVILLSWLLLSEHLTVMQWVGVTGVVVALVLVTRVRNGVADHDRKDLLFGMGLALLAMLTQAFSVVAIKPALERTPLIVATELRLLGGLLFLVPMILARKDQRTLWTSLIEWKNLRYLVPGAFSGTYLALTLMLGGVKHTLASTATVLNQTSNLFIFLLAVWLLREPAGWRRWLGILLGFVGAFLVTVGG